MTKERSAWAGAAVVCLLLAAVHTWPLASAPGTLSRNDNGDTQLNEWIMAWVAHQLPRVPAHLFQANIFYPAHDTLAYSEPLIVPALLGAPVAWLGGSPVLVFNLMVIAGFALSALAGYALLYAWTRDRAAALLAGSTFAFNTHTLTRIPHVQGLHIYGLPLALLATDRIITGTGRRQWLWLALWMTVMAYTSGYLLVFGTIMVAVALAVRVREWAPRSRATLGAFGLATLLAALAILPLSIPYQRVAREQNMVRPIESVAEYSATPTGYLAASGTIHMSTWSARFFEDPVDSFFPGVIVIALAVVAIAAIVRRRRAVSDEEASFTITRQRVLMLAAIAIIGFVLSLGTRTPLYGWLYAVFPPMRGLRAAARFGNLFLLGMSALAGLGLATLSRRTARSWRAAVAVLALVALANVEALRAPLAFRPFEGIPPIYKFLATYQGSVVLAEMPFYPRQAVFENAEYVLNSTVHWRPLMNGYSGYTPESYGQFADTLWYFPEERAIQAMRRAGVTHVMVHPRRFGRDADEVVRQVSARPEFELMAVGRGGMRLYRFHRNPGARITLRAP